MTSSHDVVHALVDGGLDISLLVADFDQLLERLQGVVAYTKLEHWQTVSK